MKKNTYKNSTRSQSYSFNDLLSLTIHILQWIRDSTMFSYLCRGLGFILQFTAIFALIAFSSHIFFWRDDQLVVETYLHGDIAWKDMIINNYCGIYGALISYELIHIFFGPTAYLLLIPIYIVGNDIYKHRTITKNIWHFLELYLMGFISINTIIGITNVYTNSTIDYRFSDIIGRLLYLYLGYSSYAIAIFILLFCTTRLLKINPSIRLFKSLSSKRERNCVNRPKDLEINNDDGYKKITNIIKKLKIKDCVVTNRINYAYKIYTLSFQDVTPIGNCVLELEHVITDAFIHSQENEILIEFPMDYTEYSIVEALRKPEFCDCNKQMPVIIGEGDSLYIIDLTYQYRILISGDDGYGKTTILHNILDSLLEKHIDDNLEIFFIDCCNDINFDNRVKTISKVNIELLVEDIINRVDSDAKCDCVIFIDNLIGKYNESIRKLLDRLDHYIGISVVIATTYTFLCNTLKQVSDVKIAVHTSTAIKSIEAIGVVGAEKLSRPGDILITHDNNITRLQIPQCI